MTREAAALDPNVETWVMQFPFTLTDEDVAAVQAQWEAAATGKRLLVIPADATLRPLTSLDAAWAEVEAALPDAPRNASVSYGVVRRHGATDGYYAYVETDLPATITEIHGHGDTPAAALLALAEKLAQR